MSTLAPQGLWRTFNSTVSNSYPGTPQVDLTASTAFRSQAFSIINMDASIVISVSFNGTDTLFDIDPADAKSVTFDNAYPTAGTIFVRSASGSPTVQIQAWA